MVFDHPYASILRQENRDYGEQGIIETVSKAGESWIFGLEEGEVEPFRARSGFAILTHYAPAELEKPYLSNAHGSLHGRYNGTDCIVIAAVKDSGRNGGLK